MAVLSLLLTTTWVVVMHFGQLHPYEKWLALTLAFGPFIVLGIVIWVRTRQAASEDAAEKRTGVGHRSGDPQEPSGP